MGAPPRERSSRESFPEVKASSRSLLLKKYLTRAKLLLQKTSSYYSKFQSLASREEFRKVRSRFTKPATRTSKCHKTIVAVQARK